jgi:hypothetical protein
MLYALEDLSPTPTAEIPNRELDCSWWDVRTPNSRQARVRVPASQTTDAERVLGALNQQVSRLGDRVVEGQMVATDGLVLIVGYDDAGR